MKNLTYIHFILSIISLLIYLRAYFPIQKSKTFFMDPPNRIRDFEFNKSTFYQPEIDRLVFIVIDALREDFITLDNMPFAYKTSNCKLKVKAEAPTVTLPRIKALTTGSVPQFIDVILNLGAGTKCEDSFLHRAFEAKKKMVFYGDDTWIKIFPDLFMRQEGTNSFYVNDFYEVDTNVTQNVENELLKNDWDIMVLHYLGLDHIGHVKGPYSNLVQPKLREMDEIIEKIHFTISDNSKRTILLVTGDHGMKNSGGHGGTTYEETHVPLLAFGINCKNKPYITQVDIPTTLSVLFGIQIPTTSIGNLVPEFLQTFDLKRRVFAIYYNLEILKQKSDVCDDELGEADELFYLLMKNYTEAEARNIYQLYEKCSLKIRDDLIHKSVEQNVLWLLFALITSISIFISIININLETKRYKLHYVQTAVILVFLFVNNSGDAVLLFLIFITSSILIVNIYSFVHKFKTIKIKHSDIIVVASFLHGLLLNSSSFIEEEHQIWYFYSTTFLVFFIYFNIKHGIISMISLLIVIRFIRTINSTGDQFASLIDLGDILKSETNFLYLQIFYATSLLLTFIVLSKISKHIRLDYLFILIMIYFYKMYFLHKALIGQIVWFSIALSTILSKFFKLSGQILITTWILVITLLMQPHNVVLIPACVFLLLMLQSHIKSLKLLSFAHYTIGSALFFYQGHSNSIASIDLTPGYIGLETYVPLLTFSFVIIHTYAFPILSLTLILCKYHDKSIDIFVIYILNRLFTLIFILFVTCLHRNHLFVWSVFAPKLLIEAAHTSMLFILVTLFYLLQFLYSLRKVVGALVLK